MLKLLEHYTSVQGEGIYTGKLTQFVRFAGCNLRCPGWPCDTPHAIFPDQYIGLYAKLTPKELVQQIITEAETCGASNVCFTGGEPFMQPIEDLQRVCAELDDRSMTVEFFTNGTFVIPHTFVNRCQIMMDWKLPGSGEYESHRETRWTNAGRLRPWHGIKFVCKTEEDLDAAVAEATLMRVRNVEATFWIGTAWDQLTEAQIVDFMKANSLGGWRLNVQVHKYVWPAEMQGV